MSYKNLKPKAFKAAISTQEDLVILDVRTPREVAEGHIEGALIIDFLAGGFDEKVKDFNKESTYYIYCRSGNRSGQACQIMAQLGFDKLVNLDGGMLGWNYPVIK